MIILRLIKKFQYKFYTPFVYDDPLSELTFTQTHIL